MRGRFVESTRVVGDTWLACVIGGVLSCVGFGLSADHDMFDETRYRSTTNSVITNFCFAI